MKQTYDCHKVNCKHVNSRRTIDQNSAMHLFYSHVAQELNLAGLPIKATLAYYKVDLDWDERSVKELIWRPIQKALLGVTSTADLKKQGDIDQVYEHINRFLSQLGVHVPFPHDPNKLGSTDPNRDKSVSVAYPENYKPTSFDT